MLHANSHVVHGCFADGAIRSPSLRRRGTDTKKGNKDTMNSQRSDRSRARRARRRVFHAEILEERRLLAASGATFSGPSLGGLIAQASQGKDTSQAVITTMLKALQTQLTAGPLAELNAGTVDGNGFVTSVQGLVSGYSANVDQQLLPR